jgi:voltage-gated sodium channel
MRIVEKWGRFAEGAAFQRVIMWLIVINAILLGLETFPAVMDSYGRVVRVLDHIILAIFVFELMGKLAYRRLAFFYEGWNWFDLIVVGIALIPAAGPLAVMRTLRVLRLLRLLSVVPSMRRVVEGLFRALPGMGSIAALILLIFYVAAVFTTNLYRTDYPDWFGDLGASFFTLFQIMTLEGWADMAREMMQSRPATWIFFLVFILSTTFAVLNLFVGVIVSAMESETAEEESKEFDRLSAQLAEMQQEMAKLRLLLEDRPRH